MLIVVVLSAFSEAPMVAGESAGFRFSRPYLLGAPTARFIRISVCIHVTMGFWA